MTQPGGIRFIARLLRPAAPARGAWTFLVLPKAASARLPTRGRTTVAGTLEGRSFRATLEPDGQGSHWLKVGRKLRESAGAVAGARVALEIAPADRELEPRVPADLRKALAAAPKARAAWAGITPRARGDWVQWVTSARQVETRARRVANACKMLASGKRRICCFDRSGIYGKGICAPEASTDP